MNIFTNDVIAVDIDKSLGVRKNAGYSKGIDSIDYGFSPQDTKKLFAGLVIFEILLVLIFAADTLLGHPIRPIRILFDLDGEGNIPAWFSSVQLFIVGLVFLLIGRQTNPDQRPSALLFLILVLGFIFLSADEAASIHEKITGALKDIQWVPRFKGDHGIWVFIYPLIGFTLFLAFYRQLIAMWNRYRYTTLIMAAGMGIFLIGALGLEIISFQFLRSGSFPLLYKVEVAFEEFFEMLGVSVILYGAMLLLREKKREIDPNIWTAA
jgi:hypothetical protein